MFLKFGPAGPSLPVLVILLGPPLSNLNERKHIPGAAPAWKTYSYPREGRAKFQDVMKFRILKNQYMAMYWNFTISKISTWPCTEISQRKIRKSVHGEIKKSVRGKPWSRVLDSAGSRLWNPGFRPGVEIAIIYNDFACVFEFCGALFDQNRCRIEDSWFASKILDSSPRSWILNPEFWIRLDSVSGILDSGQVWK